MKIYGLVVYAEAEAKEFFLYTSETARKKELKTKTAQVGNANIELLPVLNLARTGEGLIAALEWGFKAGSMSQMDMFVLTQKMRELEQKKWEEENGGDA